MQAKGSLAGGKKLAGLAALVIREKEEPLIRPLPEKNHAYRRHAVGIHAGERNGIGVVDLGLDGLLVPAVKQGEGIGSCLDLHGNSSPWSGHKAGL